MKSIRTDTQRVGTSLSHGGSEFRDASNRDHAEGKKA